MLTVDRLSACSHFVLPPLGASSLGVPTGLLVRKRWPGENGSLPGESGGPAESPLEGQRAEAGGPVPGALCPSVGCGKRPRVRQGCNDGIDAQLAGRHEQDPFLRRSSTETPGFQSIRRPALRADVFWHLDIKRVAFFPNT